MCHYAVEIFKLHLAAYSARPGFTVKWMNEIVDLSVFRVLKKVNDHTYGDVSRFYIAVRPGSWPGSSAGTGAAFLLGLFILCGLYLSRNDKKSTAASPKSDEQLWSGPTSQPSSPVRPLPKPSAIIPADTARPNNSIVPRQVPNVVSNLPGFPALHYRSMRYEATHKKVFGGCTGQLELTSVRLHFQCSNQADLNIPVHSIAKAHKDGVVLASGEKYHFLIANHTKGQVEAIFMQWLGRVQQFQQQSRKSSF